ncbi:hypothetical protein E0Z10_g2929 [Xylaria hypoxylon]|uniref:DUF985 domain-containing protein n=1 Tax=Xylaria hypoxylon TaxID=37992 RepID=A0A4Z0Z4X5_9PEZI|nr:hypothetical protein E0Z10_g2929 [Xylaria hypoxylon]
MMSLQTLLVACVAFATQTLATQCGDDLLSHDVGLSPHHHHLPTAQEVVDKLGLAPNVEGGYFVETFRDDLLLPGSNRSVNTAIYYLLEGPNVPSVWHRVDAAEIWHWYAGAPLILDISSNNGTPTRSHTLGPDLFSDQRPQVVILANDWQRAISCGNWTLVGTTVAPAFVAGGYELAPDGWEPNGA